MRKFTTLLMSIFLIFNVSQVYGETTVREKIRGKIRENWIKKNLDKDDVERGLGGVDARIPLNWIPDSIMNKSFTYGPGDYGRKIYSGGLERFYEIHVPPGYDKTRPTPAVLSFHGGGGYPSSARKSSGMDAVSDRNGFIVVYPAGTGKIFNDRLLVWNDGRPDKDGKPYTADDVGFVKALLDDLESIFNIDKNRIYACGFSNGAQFSYRLAQQLSDRIAAISTIAGHRSAESYFGPPPRPISIMQFSGLQDKLAPYYGGVPPEKSGPVTLDFKFEMEPVKEVVMSWVRHNGCPDQPIETKRIGRAVMERYGPGKDNTEVILWTLEDGGHTIPGGFLFPSEIKANVGNANHDINASELMWDFFKRHALKKGNTQNNHRLGAGDYEFKLEFDKLIRGYLVHVPPSYSKDKPIPLVLNFHGGGGGAEGFRKMTGMDKSADRKGFIVVYPKGMRIDADPDKIFARFWNPGNGPKGAYNKDPLLSSVDDVGFVDAVLDDMESKFNIDKNRIYACGFSNGACLVHLLACRLSGRIAAVAAVSGAFWNDPSEYVLERPVPIIYFHGTKDPCSPYNGGPCGCEAGIAGKGRRYISAEETVKIWREKDGCLGEPEITYQKGGVICKTYKQCNAGAEVTFYTIEGGGHTWPGGRPYKIPGFDIGKVTYDISANDAIWDFFKRHKLKSSEQ